MFNWQVKSCRALVIGTLMSVAAPAIAGSTTILAQGTIDGENQFIGYTPLSAGFPTPTTYKITFDKSVKDFLGQINYYQAHEGNYYDAKGNLIDRVSDNWDDQYEYFTFLPNPGKQYTAFSVPFSGKEYGGDYNGGYVIFDVGLIPYRSGIVASTIEGATNYVLTAYQPVPEPQTWTLMMLGLGMVGAGIRRSRRLPRSSGGTASRLNLQRRTFTSA